MKYIITLFLLLSAYVYSQDSEPTPWDFKWGFSSTPRVFEPDSFQQNSIFTGFQWGGSWQMNNALLNNFSEMGNYKKATGQVNIPINLILQPSWINSTAYYPGYFGAVMMQYDPSLPLDSTNEGTIIRPDDPADPVFGFESRQGTILTNPADPNYSRLILYQNASYVGDTVLKHIWPQPNFDSETSGGQTDHYPGKMWYLTINLKRLKPSIETIKDDSVVLSLKIPYTRWDDTTRKIRFNKLPVNSPNATYDMNYFEDRGKAQQMATVDPAVDSIAITRNMLPISSDGYESITISAEFATNNNLLDFNPEFSRKYDTLEIKSLDIEVNYYGHTDIAIDWIRVENVRAHHLLQGELDSLGTMNGWPYRDSRGNIEIVDDLSNPGVTVQVNTIKDIVQSAIDSVKVASNNWQDAKIYRLKFQDTESDGYYWWGTLRYCNKFANGIYMTSDAVVNSEIYKYYTESTGKIVAMRLGNGTEAAVPWMRTGTGNWRTMNIKRGYFKRGDTTDEHTYFDTLSSEYETQVTPYGAMNDWSDLKNDEFYSNHLNYGSVLQVKYENSIIDKFYKKPQQSFLYSGTNWIYQNIIYNVQLFTDTVDLSKNIVYDYSRRPHTAELFRLFNMGAIIRGAKGIMTDGDENQRLPDVLSMGVGDYTKLNAYNDIYSDSVGSDFINYNYNTWNALLGKTI